MDKDFSHRIAAIVVLLVTTTLNACGTPAARDFGGTWRAVNRFQDQPTEIPLAPAYAYYASPMDETLRTMLSRWAKDSGRTLDYRLDFDVTLYQPVSAIHTTDILSATSQVNSIYAAEGVSITANGHRIVVQRASGASTNAAGAQSRAGGK